jgi:RNA polymerase sigma-B factor
VSSTGPQRVDRELLRAYHERGDLEARDRLIEEYLPLARSLARRYAGRGEQYDDLVQIATVGLIKAVDRFDFERGAELTTYAVATIVGELKRHFRDAVWPVHVPRRLKELNRTISRLLEDLTSSLGRSPTIGELAQAAGIEEEEVIDALETGRAFRLRSLSVPGGDESDPHPLDTIGEDEHGFEVSEDRTVLTAGLRALDDRERRIIHLRFYQGLTQSQIAVELGISQMHVSRLIRGALEKMREEIEGSEAAEGGKEG